MSKSPADRVYLHMVESLRGEVRDQPVRETIILTAHRKSALAVLFVAIAMVAGCGKKQSQHSGPAHQLKKDEMSAAEQKYGIAPIPDSSVTYQPDVIVVGGVGYLIPKSVTKLINSILSALNIKYQINGEGSLSPSEAITIINSTSTLKGCQAGKV